MLPTTTHSYWSNDIAGLDAGGSHWMRIMQGETGCSAGLQVTCSQNGSEMKRCTA